MDALPPLNAIRAFEAAGRHLSFTRAATELNVTHGAVSRQVARLETRLGARLFVRTAGGLVLTERGRMYLGDVIASLDRLRAGTRRVAHAEADTVVRLSVPPTFAMRWLIPRLAEFTASHRGFTLELSTAMAQPDFVAGAYDAAIRRMRRVPRALEGHRFLGAGTVAVCSQDYAREHRLAQPSDLVRATLITTATEPSEWDRWYRAQRAPVPSRQPPSLAFEQLFFALQAAVDSLGVALAPEALVKQDLEQGRLVAPFSGKPLGDRAYTLAFPPDSPKRAALRLLAQWLLAKGRGQVP
jgi:LysR family transcriptional regulator, glycine cleavage system transcriptional activator